MPIVSHRNIFYILSALFVGASFVALALWGLRLGIDFKGGSLMEVSYPVFAPSQDAIEKVLAPFSDEGLSVRSTAEADAHGFIIRTRELSETEHDAALQALSFGGEHKATEVRFDSVGPVLGAEAARKSLLAVALVLVVIVLFIAFAFRKVSAPVSSWKYGFIAIAALVHDVSIPTGLFALLGHFAGVEVDTLFVTALLVVLGFSVHDTIVVFDRVREHLRHRRERSERAPFEQIVGESVSETIGRSVNTSLTTLLALFALLFFGPVATHFFALALIVGIIAGTYSSICIAAPLLVTVERWHHRS